MLSISVRDHRTLAWLPGDRIAWFPTDAEGADRLAREAMVLGAIARHCSFRVPRVEFGSPDGWQLRQAVPGTVDPFALYARLMADPGLCRRLGRDIGAALAEQHRIPAGVLPALPSVPSWPPPRHVLDPGLRRATSDTGLIRRCLDFADRLEPASLPPVLAHCDLGLHNMRVAPDGALVGIFDYDEAALTDPHYDFRYLLVETDAQPLFEAAVAAYRAAGGPAIDFARVADLKAAAAIGFLASRDDASPDDRPAGRTLAEDLKWVASALRRAGAV